MQWYLMVLQKYAVFSGRSRRMEYWMFALINFVISIVLSLVFSLIHLKFVPNLYTLAVLIPSIAVGIRRLHDTNRVGWWLLIGIIPIIGWIWLLILLVQPGTAGSNNYGPDPIAETAGA